MAKAQEGNEFVWRSMGMSDEEYAMVQDLLGRDPNYVELGMFSVMWSEHCSYKNSRAVLKGLPTSGPQVLQGPGENAGIVDVGDGLGVAFKIESHNHPSAVEPYEGAATGVGGIIRDIFTMGARPIASLNSLWLGDLKSEKSRMLFDGIVSGISGYGNAVGVPTVGGQTVFHESYNNNPLVNAMCVGVMRQDEIKRGAASGVGNSVMLIGSTTGRDGIHGATFASADLTEEAVEKKSAVQVGDPFREKLLLEACLELVARECVLGIQDMGAAGLTCASCEMAARGGVGMVIDIDKVPRREEGMTPYEVMLSESQERMLLVPVPGKEAEVKEVLEKWDLLAEVIGEVTDDGLITLVEGGKVVAEVPAKALTDEAPLYHRESVRPSYIDELASYDTKQVESPDDLARTLVQMIGSPNLASKKWVYRQYDQQVGAGTVVAPGSDAAVVRLPGTSRGVALTCDCNSRYCYSNPRLGAAHAVAEAARNLACTGARPLAATNCQNFGNPYTPEVFWQFKECIGGMADACRVLNTPVTGGNVSFCNEDGETAIRPTPVIGMVGVIDDVETHVSMGFGDEGDAIVLLGTTRDEIGASEYLAVIHGVEAGRVPEIDLGSEKRLCELLVEAAAGQMTKSAHDLSEGGLGVALAECCIAGSIGATIELKSEIAPDRFLFSETPGRAVVTVDAARLGSLLSLAEKMGVPAQSIGEVGGDSLSITFDKSAVVLPVAEMTRVYEEAIPCAMDR